MWNRIPALLFISAFGVLLLTAESCKTYKTVSAKSNTAKLRDYSLPDSSWKCLVRYHPYFSYKAKVDYEDGNQSQSFLFNVRIAHDSLIWASFSGPLNIELARVLADRDSVKIWNKMSGEKSTNPISFIKKYLPFEGDFFMLEDFLMANPLNILRITPKVEGDSANTNFTQSDVKIFVQHQADMKNCTLLSVLLKDMMLKQQMDVTFENYLKPESGNFSTKRTINIKRGEQNIKISAEIYKYGPASGLEFPFW